LQVNGDGALIGKLTSGSLTSSSLQVNGDGALTGKLTSGSLTSSSLQVNGNGALTGSLTSGSLTSSSLQINGNGELTGSLTSSSLQINGNGVLTGGLTSNWLTVTGQCIVQDGLYAQGSVSAGGVGVHGGGTSVGVMGLGQTSISGSTGIGVIGSSQKNLGIQAYSAEYHALYAHAGSKEPNVYAGFFEGNMYVSGAITKSGGGFTIDHPLEPVNKYLTHSFVESPDMMNIYNGIITCDDRGSAVVQLPDWFEKLNSDYRYLLTPIGAPANLYVAADVKSGSFTIGGGAKGLKISWQVTGIRQDPWAQQNRLTVESDKQGDDRGRYLSPEAYGQPTSSGIHHHTLLKQVPNARELIVGERRTNAE
jgi:hypothetical protein